MVTLVLFSRLQLKNWVAATQLGGRSVVANSIKWVLAVYNISPLTTLPVWERNRCYVI